jgi:hypothetical protein
MNLRTSMAFLCALGPIVTACYADRPLLVVTSDDAAAPGSAGSDGTGTGAAGSASGAAGYAGGTAGVGAAGTGGGGAAGTGGPVGSCDAKPIILKYSCALAGSCHDALGSAAGLDFATPGWEDRLVGTFPSGGGEVATRSMCAGLGRPYLVAGSNPAMGLLLDKLRLHPPPCGAAMPDIGGPLTASELACVQLWANALTARQP